MTGRDSERKRSMYRQIISYWNRCEIWLFPINVPSLAFRIRIYTIMKRMKITSQIVLLAQFTRRDSGVSVGCFYDERRTYAVASASICNLVNLLDKLISVTDCPSNGRGTSWTWVDVADGKDSQIVLWFEQKFKITINKHLWLVDPSSAETTMPFSLH